MGIIVHSGPGPQYDREGTLTVEKHDLNQQVQPPDLGLGVTMDWLSGSPQPWPACEVEVGPHRVACSPSDSCSTREQEEGVSKTENGP